MPMEDVSSVLWRERSLLDRLLFRLAVERLVLSTGRPHWLPVAAQETEVVVEEMRSAELLRAMSVDALAGELGLPPNPSLRDIAASSREPWRTIWLEHHQALATLAAQVLEASQDNRRLVLAGHRGDRA